MVDTSDVIDLMQALGACGCAGPDYICDDHACSVYAATIDEFVFPLWQGYNLIRAIKFILVILNVIL